MRPTAISARKIFFLAIVVGFTCSVNGSAQTTTRWLQQFGSGGSDQARATASSQYATYVFGVTTGTLPSQGSAGQDDAFLRKYDFGGAVAWTRQFGTAGVETGDAV